MHHVMLNVIPMERVDSWMHERIPLIVSDGIRPLCKREVAGSIPAGSTKRFCVLEGAPGPFVRSLSRIHSLNPGLRR